MTPIPFAFINQYLPEEPAKILDLSMNEYTMISEPASDVRIYKAAFSEDQAMHCMQTWVFEDIFCTDPERLPFVDENFHMVLHAPLDQELLEHMDCFRECLRVLRPEGIIVGWYSGQLFPEDEQQLRRFMERFGVELLEHTENNHFIGRKMN